MTILPNILINRQGAAGDVLMTTPIVREIYKSRNGQCNIDFCTRSEFSKLLEYNPYIRTVSNRFDLLKYDLVVNLDLVYEKNPGIHAIDAYSLSTFGIRCQDKRLDLYTSNQDKEKVKKFTESFDSDFVVIHIRNLSWASRNLPAKFWEQITKKILDLSSASIVYIGTNLDITFSGNSRLIDARGKFNFLELKELIAASKVYIGTDSGPVHIAATTDTSIVAMYTSVKSDYRVPARTTNNFYAYAADIECYGCQETYPAPTTQFICHRNDVECVNRFDSEKISQKIIGILNGEK